MKKYLILALVSILWSCSDFNELVKSSDYDKKFEAAKEYYEEGDYLKSETLLKELLSIYKGTKRAEEIYYYYAYSYYGMRDYDYAAFHFKNFVKNFPRSEKAEEVSYMIAVCYDKLSPEASLDQSNTHKAIQEYQLFLDKYPNTDKRKDVNKAIDELRDKLEVKAYELAYLYYKVSDYKAAVIALENVIKQYPDINNIAEIRYYIVDAGFKLAENSVESKKQERYEAVLDYIDNFNRSHSESEFKKDVDKIQNQTKKALSLYVNN